MAEQKPETVDFEVNDRGTINKLVLTDMCLRAALKYIDGLDSVFMVGASGELFDNFDTLEQLRNELGKGYREGELTQGEKHESTEEAQSRRRDRAR